MVYWANFTITIILLNLLDHSLTHSTDFKSNSRTLRREEPTIAED